MEHFKELASDPAHWAFEVLSTAVIEILVLALLWPYVIRPIIQRYVKREHAKIDAEHGVIHKEPNANRRI